MTCLLRATFAASCLLAACGGAADDTPRADIRTELEDILIHGGHLDAVDDAVYLRNQSGVQVLAAESDAPRRVFDETYRACPWINAWDSPSADDEVTVTYGGGRAYFAKRLCGLWSISLAEPSKVVPIARISGSSTSGVTASWADGVPLQVGVARPMAAVADGDGVLVCLQRDDFHAPATQLWSVSADGTAARKVAESEGGGACSEVLRDDLGAFVVVDGVIKRWDRTSTTLSIFAAKGGAKSLQATATHLFYFDGDRVVRIGKDGKGRMEIPGDPNVTNLGARFLADEGGIYIATSTEIVRVPQDGGPAETVVVPPSGSFIATDGGFVKAGEDRWFILQSDSKSYLARIPR